MKKIGLVSDTHGDIDPEWMRFFDDVDEIWHAGDLGTEEVLNELEKLKPTRAVFGNIDSSKIRSRTEEHLRFTLEGLDVWITHIGGYPGRYDSKVKPEMFQNPPDLFISGHSHILKVINDKKLNLLHINPGAAGNKGWHKLVTVVKFDIEDGKVQNLQLFEKHRKSKLI